MRESKVMNPTRHVGNFSNKDGNELRIELTAHSRNPVVMELKETSITKRKEGSFETNQQKDKI